MSLFMRKSVQTVAAALFTIALLLVGCAEVDITKTGRGYFPPTDPNTVDILFTRPDRRYTELGSVTATKQKPRETAKLHNTLRAKAAPLGANAVIILSQGFDAQNRLWATGVAVRYDEGAASAAMATPRPKRQ
jgi:hypothetical protein